MLEALFLSVLNMSITASLVILMVLLVRLLLKKSPKFFSYALWAVVFFRLLCPFTIETELSVIPPTGEIASIYFDSALADIDFQTPADLKANLEMKKLNPEYPVYISHSATPTLWISSIWLCGVSMMLIYSIIQFARLKRKLIGSTPLQENIYLADHISCPFVMGFVNPNIYLPSSMAEPEQAFIIAHEQYHIKRFDHITRILGFIALTIHWFNPLVWLAFILSGNDMEMSCDEAVMKRMGTDIRSEYSQSLLRFATGRKFIAATPLAFGEGDTKARVKNVMKYKKPMLWVSVCTCIVVLIVGIGFVANPKADMHFPMTGNNLSDLQPWEITQTIGQIVGKDFSELVLTPDNFGLTVSDDFSYIESEAIRFLYDIGDESCKAAQLRIFPTEADFFITEPNNNWVAPKEQVFTLYFYLEALKYLPQSEIAALCTTPPQRYSIQISVNDREYNEGRQIFYNKDGATGNGDWNIRLDIQPMYEADGSFNGVGNDIIHVYYSASEKPIDDSIDN